MPKPAHGTYRLEQKTSSTKLIMNGFLKLYDAIVDKQLWIRKINICVGNLSDGTEREQENQYEQIDLFTDYREIEQNQKEEKQKMQKEKKIQKTIINLKNKYGKNVILKGMNLQEGATTIERNAQIGGHKE